MTDFINEFQSNLDLNDFDRWFEDKLYKLYLKQEKQNKHRIISKYFEYWDREENKKYFLLSFLKFLWKKKKFYDEDLVNWLKKQIHDYLCINTWLFDCFIISLDILFLVYDDKKYFKNLFNDYRNKISWNARILMTFCDNFLKMKEINYFFECIILILKTESRIFYEFDIRQRFLSLNNSEFKKYFIKLINNFSKNENKEHLKHYGEYRWLVSKWYSEQDKKIINSFIQRILKVFNKKEKTKIKKFLFWDFNFMARNFLNIESNYFDNELFSILSKEDENILYNFLRQSDLRILSWHNAQFIGNNLNTENVQKCINLYKWDINNFFYVYLFLRSKRKTKILNIIKNSEIFPSLSEIEKRQKENRKIREREENNRMIEWKKWLLALTRTDEWFYANFLQDYYNLINNKENYEKFSTSEKNKLDKAAKSQSLSCLKYSSIKNYEDEKINDILFFQEKWEWSYSISRYAHYLYRVLNISQFLNFDISCYYKNFIVLYPLLFSDEAMDDFLKFFDWNIVGEDIDYMLKLYSEDVCENAIWMRYYNYNWICKFYKKFSWLFSSSQKNKLKSILLDFIGSSKVKSKDTVLDLYAKLTNKEEFKQIYKQPKINYFKSIISNEKPVSEEKKEEFRKQDKINKLLISNFHDINALLRRINQLKKWRIWFINNSLKDWEIIWQSHFVSAIENELEFWHEKENFAYIITNNYLINKQEIKWKMLELFELWLKIENDIKRNKEKKDYKAYSYYLINIFYKYVDNLKNKKRYYTNAMNLVWKYPESELNISTLNKHFWINWLSSIERNPCAKLQNKINDLIYKNVELSNENLKLRLNNKELKQEKTNLQNFIWIANPKCIIFVEWKTDKTILEKAYSILYWENNNFVIRIAWWARQVEELIKNDNESFERITIIGIVDYDNEWFLSFENFKDSWQLKKNPLFFVQNQEYKNYYLLSLPIPTIRPWLAWPNLWKKSMITIESLFSEKVFSNFFNQNDNRDIKWKDISFIWNQILYFTEDTKEKIKFANFVKTLNNKNDFSEFKPLFETIKDIIDWNFN